MRLVHTKDIRLEYMPRQILSMPFYQTVRIAFKRSLILSSPCVIEHETLDRVRTSKMRRGLERSAPCSHPLPEGPREARLCWSCNARRGLARGRQWWVVWTCVYNYNNDGFMSWMELASWLVCQPFMGDPFYGWPSSVISHYLDISLV